MLEWGSKAGVAYLQDEKAPALIDDGGLTEGGVDTGEERAPAADWGVATKEHLTLHI